MSLTRQPPPSWIRQLAPLVLAGLLFFGLDIEGYVDGDRLAEGLSSAGVLGSIFMWLVQR